MCQQLHLRMSVSLLRILLLILFLRNFVKPFLESNMLQLIFLAILIGIALGKIGDYSKILKDIFEACNSLFLKITVILVQFIPIATFASVLTVILKTGPDVLLSMLAMLGTFTVGIIVMLGIYCLLILFDRTSDSCTIYKEIQPYYAAGVWTGIQ